MSTKNEAYCEYIYPGAKSVKFKYPKTINLIDDGWYEVINENGDIHNVEPGWTELCWKDCCGDGLCIKF